MTIVQVTQEQFTGVQDLMKADSRDVILDKHTRAVDTGNKKFWKLATLNDLSKEQMALLLYNPSLVSIEPSTEDKLRALAQSADNVNFYNGVLETAELLGFPRSIFESVPYPDEPEEV